MTAPRYANAAQQRVLRTLRLLTDLGPTGASPSYIAAGIGTLRSNTTRDLANLRIAGLATATNGRWYASSDATAGPRNQPAKVKYTRAGDAATGSMRMSSRPRSDFLSVVSSMSEDFALTS